MQFINSIDFAAQLDEQDNLKSFRQQFLFPQHQHKDVIYFCGNSLGLLTQTNPRLCFAGVERLEKFWCWRTFMAKIRGIPITNFWEITWHLLQVQCRQKQWLWIHSPPIFISCWCQFYKPTSSRFKIICEGSAFPSDQYALQTQVKFHGFNPDETIIELHPRSGEYTIRHEDILSTITKHKDELALIFLGNLNYYTGRVFDMAGITQAGMLQVH